MSDLTQNEIEHNLDLSNEQSRAWHRLTNPKYNHITRVVYGGQAGGGKSFLISLWLDFMCNEYPGTRWYMGRETLKDIKESVLLTFFDVVKITGSNCKYRENHSKITYSNGSEIYLLETFAYPSDPNFDSFGSREYTGGAIEEGITVTKRAADILISRTRYKHDVYNLYPKQLITCNPGDGWIKDEIVIPQLEGNPKKLNEVFIQATLASNPNKEFADRYTKTLEENLTAYDRERLLNGNWNAKPKSGAEFLKEFNQDRHCRKNLFQTYDPTAPLHITFDENLHPHITCQIWQIKKVNDMRYARHLWDICLRPPRNRRKEVCKEIVKRFHGLHVGGLIIYGDATSLKEETDKEPGENFFTDILEGLKLFNPKLKVPLKNPPVLSKGGFMNLILEKSYRNITLEVDTECKTSINDYAYAVEDEDGTILKKRVKDPQTQISYEQHGHCFVAGTMVTTIAGQIPIEQIKAGDRVLTRKGWKRVLKSAMTKKNAPVFKYDLGPYSLICTDEHPILTMGLGFIQAKSLTLSDTLFIFDPWKRTLSFTKAANLHATQTPKQGLKGFTIPGDTMVKRDGCMWLSGKSTIKENALQNIIYITLTRIRLTIISTIWDACRAVVIFHCTVKKAMEKLRQAVQTLKKYAHSLRHGMPPKRDINGMSSMGKEHSRQGLTKIIHAGTAENNSSQNLNHHNYAQTTAAQPIEENQGLITKIEIANTVDRNLHATNMQRLNIVPRSAQGLQNVYNLSVEDCPEFFANGVLVHNSIDAASYFLCEAFLPDFNYYLSGGVKPQYDIGNDRKYKFER